MPRKKRRYTDQFYAPVPTRWNVFWRRFIPFQIWRFLVLNYKIIKVVVLGHS